MTKKKLSDASTVYTASAWWRESDPSMQVVTLTAKKAQTLITKMMRQAARDAYNDESYDTIRAAESAIAWSGVHAFALKDLASSRELNRAIDDLEADGVWYPEGL